ncbi:glycoside hydrolase family 43 protein [Rathayibacter sp. YIM 133350]|uniref:glycoside hydrolase family 43 protein n=1 Tax=Rathayibacter sp. YIM 133350 TaxID=3131992 RepID=UPI00307D2D28
MCLLRTPTRGIVGAVAVTALLALSGCSGAGSTSQTPASTFVIDASFADPDLISTSDGYVAYATNSPSINVQLATSTDLEHWDLSDQDALPTLPSWAVAGRTWAPDVSELPNGGFVMFVVAEDRASQKQCIGTATSPTAAGPFTPVGDAPLLCPLDQGGAIDPSTFVDDDGTAYLLWKNDGNCCNLDTWIEIAPLAADRLSLAGASTRLFTQTEQWEGNLVEAPTMLKHGDRYIVLYSANDYATDAYAIGVASAPALSGPYEKQPGPLLSTESSDGRYYGPGGQEVLHTDDGDRLFFHSWDENVIYRGMNAVALTWKDDLPVVKLP